MVGGRYGPPVFATKVFLLPRLCWWLRQNTMRSCLPTRVIIAEGNTQVNDSQDISPQPNQHKPPRPCCSSDGLIGGAVVPAGNAKVVPVAVTWVLVRCVASALTPRRCRTPGEAEPDPRGYWHGMCQARRSPPFTGPTRGKRAARDAKGRRHPTRKRADFRSDIYLTQL